MQKYRVVTFFVVLCGLKNIKSSMGMPCNKNNISGCAQNQSPMNIECCYKENCSRPVLQQGNCGYKPSCLQEDKNKSLCGSGSSSGSGCANSSKSVHGNKPEDKAPKHDHKHDHKHGQGDDHKHDHKHDHDHKHGLGDDHKHDHKHEHGQGDVHDHDLGPSADYNSKNPSNPSYNEESQSVSPDNEPEIGNEYSY
ncbi:uncharacterized protein NESG_00185 [Nematocida ausubeli]|uniref:Uncharacterized protein n=1 Tax=Nematocida ausubeli (strain ATCC PRA-371 / ERTm2) TaxID=1913371 RepID=A0A086J4P2_NEMA1|nr:uncharacterized protein NESG_00185 [Nematocida ausubeli]KFG27110.1 hypothetical protein NESG_00185 [Nematocida ausubeli]